MYWIMVNAQVVEAAQLQELVCKLVPPLAKENGEQRRNSEVPLTWNDVCE